MWLAVDECACLVGVPERAEVTRSAQGAKPLAEFGALRDAESDEFAGAKVGACLFPAVELTL